MGVQHGNKPGIQIQGIELEKGINNVYKPEHSALHIVIITVAVRRWWKASFGGLFWNGPVPLYLIPVTVGTLENQVERSTKRIAPISQTKMDYSCSSSFYYMYTLICVWRSYFSTCKWHTATLSVEMFSENLMSLMCYMVYYGQQPFLYDLNVARNVYLHLQGYQNELSAALWN